MTSRPPRAKNTSRARTALVSPEPVPRNVPAAIVAVLGTPAVTVAGTARKVDEEAGEDDEEEVVSAGVDVVAAAAVTVEPASSASPRDRKETMAKRTQTKLTV